MMGTRPQTRIGHTLARHPLCPACGYDLVAATEQQRIVCPECGERLEFHELLREVKPGDWTPLRGLQRLGMIATLRAMIACAVLTGVLILVGWITGPLAQIVSVRMRILLVLTGLLTLPVCGWLGWFLARNADEHAGFSGVLLMAILSAFAIASIIIASIIAQLTGLLNGPTLTGVLVIGSALAITLVVRTVLMNEY